MSEQVQANILYRFIMDMDKTPEQIRYAFVGFRSEILHKVAELLLTNEGIEIKFIKANEVYREAIDSRALNEPVIIDVPRSRAGEFASILNTMKIVENRLDINPERFVSHRRARTFNLLDIACWLFQNKNLNGFLSTILSPRLMGHKEKLESFLSSAWLYSAKTHPSFVTRLSLENIAEFLTSFIGLKGKDLSEAASCLGLERSLRLVIPQQDLGKVGEEFFESSRRVHIVFLPRSNFYRYRRTLAKQLENLVRGILVQLAIDPAMSKRLGITNATALLEEYEISRDERGRRTYVVLPESVSILDYSRRSALPNFLSFGIWDSVRGKNASSKFCPSVWNHMIAKYEKSKGFKDRSLTIDAPGNAIEVRFNYLEGYLFALRPWEREAIKLLQS